MWNLGNNGSRIKKGKRNEKLSETRTKEIWSAEKSIATEKMSEINEF